MVDIRDSGSAAMVPLEQGEMEWHIVLGEVVIRVAVRIRDQAIEAMAAVDLSAVADGARALVAGMLGS